MVMMTTGHTRSTAIPAASAPAPAAVETPGQEECPLAAIFYADFNNVSGRKIVHQYPPDKFTEPHCKMLSSRIICDKPFCEKVTVIDSMAIPWTLASFPSSISDTKYDRGIFSYNISFVFKKGHPHTPRSGRDDGGDDKKPFVKVLERLGWWLREMELRFGYLYGGKGSKIRLRECLGRVYKGIKAEGRAWLMMTGPGCPLMMLLLQPYLASTPSKNWREIQDHDVPVRRCAGLVESVSATTTTSGITADQEAVWGAEVDMVVQQVLPHINGVKHVKKISRDSQVEIAAVKGALQWVLYTNQILLTDVFRYGNVYVQTATTEEYTSREDFRMACWERIAKPITGPTPEASAAATAAATTAGTDGQDDGSTAPTTASTVGASGGGGGGVAGGGFDVEETGVIPEAPHPRTLRFLYASFQSDRRVMDVLRMAEGPEGFIEQFDHRRMCSFGVEVGILRRLHCAPLCKRAEGKEAAATREVLKNAGYPRRSLGARFELEYVQRLMNGRRTEDALCCFLSCSPQELTDFAKSDGSKVYRTHPF